MAFKIPVEDRVSTYPGRVTLTPVEGLEYTYTLVRADEPVVDGTPINKQLLDNKAYTLTENVTVYVSTSGNDASGDGSADSPFGTIQGAINALPKNLGGYTATISIAVGTYNERVSINGFSNGRLIVGVSGRNVTVQSISIIGSSLVEINIPYITKTISFSDPVLLVDEGSNVLVNSTMKVDAGGATVVGISATNFSSIYASDGATVTVSNCNSSAVSATRCSLISFDTITGVDNVVGLAAARGGVISYKTETMSNMWGNIADTGGLVLTGTNSNELSGATLDL